jgi:hypothetical protein
MIPISKNKLHLRIENLGDSVNFGQNIDVNISKIADSLWEFAN